MKPEEIREMYSEAYLYPEMSHGDLVFRLTAATGELKLYIEAVDNLRREIAMLKTQNGNLLRMNKDRQPGLVRIAETLSSAAGFDHKGKNEVLLSVINQLIRMSWSGNESLDMEDLPF